MVKRQSDIPAVTDNVAKGVINRDMWMSDGDKKKFIAALGL